MKGGNSAKFKDWEDSWESDRPKPAKLQVVKPRAASSNEPRDDFSPIGVFFYYAMAFMLGALVVYHLNRDKIDGLFHATPAQAVSQEAKN